MNIKEFMKKNFGGQFCVLISPALLKDFKDRITKKLLLKKSLLYLQRKIYVFEESSELNCYMITLLKLDALIREGAVNSSIVIKTKYL